MSDTAASPGTGSDTAMSALASAQRSQRQHWATPGGRHDKAIRRLKRGLPIVTGLMAGVLAMAPFLHQSEVSFVLDKKKVDMSAERLKVIEALYRGEDSKGRPFSLRAGSAVQKSSREPIVQLTDLEARLQMDQGSALVTAEHGAYDLAKDMVSINGPIRFEREDGYRLTTRDVDISLGKRSLHSRGPVEGRIPTGTFRADHLSADLENRTVSLDGGARLRIEQFGRKGR
jgi:lipopolysaccharide export system protein LptC